MSDPGINPEFDAEVDDEVAELAQYLQHMKRTTGDISYCINISKLSDKDEKSAKLKSIIKAKRLSVNIQKKTKEITEKHALLTKDIDELKTMMALKNTDIDKNIQLIQENTAKLIKNLTAKENDKQAELDKETEKLARVQTEMAERIEPLEKKIDSIKGCIESVQQMEAKIIKKLQADEARAEAELAENIEAIEKKIDSIENSIDQNIQSMKQKAKEHFEKRRKEIKDNEVEKLQTLKLKKVQNEKKIEAEIKRSNDLLIKKGTEIEQNIKNMQEVLQFKNSLAAMREREAAKTSEVNGKIQKMKNTLMLAEGELTETLEILRQYEQNETNKMEAELQAMTETRAQKKEDVIQALRNKLEKAESDLEKNIIETMRQNEAEKKGENEAELQKWSEIFAQKQDSIEKSIKATEITRPSQNKRTHDQESLQGIETLQPCGAEQHQVKRVVHAQGKENFEKNIEPPRKRVCEQDASGGQISVQHSRAQPDVTLASDRTTPVMPNHQNTLSATDIPRQPPRYTSPAPRWAHRSPDR